MLLTKSQIRSHVKAHLTAKSLDIWRTLDLIINAVLFFGVFKTLNCDHRAKLEFRKSSQWICIPLPIFLKSCNSQNSCVHLLIYLKGRSAKKRSRDRDSRDPLSYSQMTPTAKAGPRQSQEPGAAFWCPLGTRGPCTGAAWFGILAL